MTSTRREFLGAAVAATAFSIVPRHVLGGPGFVPPSEKVHVAMVGAGGRAFQNLRQLLNEKDCHVVAVADPVPQIDKEGYFYKAGAGREPMRSFLKEHYAKSQQGYECKGYEDFRELLEAEQDVDAIVCSTPDHWHASVSIPAMKAGKHVYCEKPLAHNVWEAREMARVAEESGVATQMGNQGHSRPGTPQTVEWIQAGAIGPVREVHAWAPTSRWNKTLAGPPRRVPCRKGSIGICGWGHVSQGDIARRIILYLGADFWDFGAGTLGDFACHDLDGAFWALDLSKPARVEGVAAGYMDNQITPHGELVYYDFEARGDLPPTKVIWYGGGIRPETPVDWPADQPFASRGTMFVGDEGVIFQPGAGGDPVLLGKRGEEFERPPETIERSKGHYREWLDACKGGKPAGSQFAYGAGLTETVLLGVLSLRLGKPFAWDAAGMVARDLPEADKFLKESYREPYRLIST